MEGWQGGFIEVDVAWSRTMGGALSARAPNAAMREGGGLVEWKRMLIRYSGVIIRM